MEALKVSYASSSEEEGDDDIETVPSKKPKLEENGLKDTIALPPPPPDLLFFPSNSAYKNGDSGNRIRSFPHVEGNYALHVYIPVNISSIAEKQLAPFIKKAGMLVPELYGIDTDLPLCSAYLKSNDGAQVHAPPLAKQYHISLSRTVAIRVHQIDSIVAMLRHKLHSQKRYWIEFGKWEVFINDDQTRSFLAMEVTTGGLSEVHFKGLLGKPQERVFLQSLLKLQALQSDFSVHFPFIFRFLPETRGYAAQIHSHNTPKELPLVGYLSRFMLSMRFSDCTISQNFIRILAPIYQWLGVWGTSH